jgi:hypothetical protein
VFELLLILGLIGLLAAAAALSGLAWITLLTIGAWLMLVGMVAGVPAGAVYHALLYRALRVSGPLPRRWWLRPHALHDRLVAPARRAVLGWFNVGALGFLATVIGCLLAGLGAAHAIAVNYAS